MLGLRTQFKARVFKGGVYLPKYSLFDDNLLFHIAQSYPLIQIKQ